MDRKGRSKKKCSKKQVDLSMPRRASANSCPCVGQAEGEHKEGEKKKRTRKWRR
jgi:hypothetical protein